jgi:hypothetical protein
LVTTSNLLLAGKAAEAEPADQTIREGCPSRRGEMLLIWNGRAEEAYVSNDSQKHSQQRGSRRVVHQYHSHLVD